jgi:glycosyltransferase involved in cell wall biosynthesis
MEQLAGSKQNVQLTVAGDGPKRGLVEKYAARCPQVRYEGFVGYDRLDAILRSSDVGIVPMRTSSGVSIPNKIADYAGYGLAVLNGLEGVSEKALSEYDAGVMYQVDDRQSFVSAIHQMLGDPSWVMRMRRNARKLAEEHFDADKIYPAFARWIEDKTSAK